MISVMINTYNRSNILIENLKRLTPLWNKVEIVIIDDYSTDNTEDLVKCFIAKNKAKIKYVHNIKNRGYARSLNIGIENCSNDFIFILNDDNFILDIEKFIQILRKYETKNYIIGSHLIDDKKPFLKQINGFIYRTFAEIFAGEVYNYNGNKKRMVNYCNNIFGFNKNIGIMFDEKSYIKNMYRIESDFQERARKNGIKILYYPEIKTLHKWVEYGGVREKRINLLLCCIYNHITFLRKNFKISKYYKIPCYFLLKTLTHPYLITKIIKTFNDSFKHRIY